MNSLILNDMVLSDDIKNAFFELDDNVTIACDTKAKEICSELFPGIDFGRQENIDLVIRPLSAVIAINEIVLQGLFSESTLDGIKNSKTLPSSMKAAMFKNFASLNGIRTASSDPESLYSEISFFIKNNNINRKDIFSNSILEEFDGIDRLYFADTTASEMVRSRIPYVQINHLKVMDFSRSEFNKGTLIGGGYSRADFQRYQDYKKSDKVSIPGVLDIYFSSKMKKETVSVQKGEKYYTFPPAYYVSITSTKDTIAVEQDIFSNGIVKSHIDMFIANGEQNETFEVVTYEDPMFENYSKNEEFSITDVIHKGFYPLFIDLEMFTRDDIDILELRAIVEEYLSLNGGNMLEVSINDMQNYIRARGITVSISPKSKSKLFSSMNIPVPMDAIFPLSVKDIKVPPELDSALFSANTIKIFLGEVNVTKE